MFEKEYVQRKVGKMHTQTSEAYIDNNKILTQLCVCGEGGGGGGMSNGKYSCELCSGYK